jgi:hypothetical protein
VLGFRYDSIYACLLHLRIRITEKLLKLTLQDLHVGEKNVENRAYLLLLMLCCAFFDRNLVFGI